MRREGGWSWMRTGLAAGLAAAALWLASPLARCAEPAPAVRTVEITASKYQFQPSRIEVKQGEQVRLILHSTDVEHGIEIKEFHVKANIPKGGDPVTVEFVADQAGTIEVKCSHFCGMGHHGMKGQLIVTPSSK